MKTMFKVKQRFMSLVFILVMIGLISTPINATSEVHTQTINLSEYEIISKYKDKSYEELINSGLNKLEAEEILNLNKTILDKTKELLKFNNKELNNLGYSEKQINALNSIKENQLSKQKSFDSLNVDEIPTEDLVIDDSQTAALLSSGVTFNVTVTPKPSTFGVTFSFAWGSKPFVLKNDAVAFAWDQGFTCPSSNVSLLVGYVGGNHNEVRYNKTIRPSPGSGVSIEFPMMYTGGKAPSNTVPSWAKSGSGGFTLVNQNNAKKIHIIWSYAHTTLAVSPGVDITGTPSISIGWGTSEEAFGDTLKYLK